MANREADHAIPESPRGSSRPIDGPRRVYTPPTVEELGDVRELTMGGSPGLMDSVDPGGRKPPG